MSNLILHRGARPVSPEELAGVKAPGQEGRWFPLPHSTVLSRVKETLGGAGYELERERLALSRGDARFFGVLDLRSVLARGVTLAVGVRNSIDKSFPLGFCAGSRVFVCDNLAFHSELLVRRKHTKLGERRFASDIALAVSQLGHFRGQEERRIRVMAGTEVAAQAADSLILRAFERGIVPHRLLSPILREWREPGQEEFRPRTYWSLLNAFTAALRERATRYPQEFAVTTMRLNALLAAEPPLATGLSATEDEATGQEAMA